MATPMLRRLTAGEKAGVGRPEHVVAFNMQIADSGGSIGVPLYRCSTLALLERRGAIGPRERAAGEEFGRLFHRAHLDPLRAADMSRTPISGGKLAGDRSSSAEYAQRRVHAALDALGGIGSPTASCVWHVLGNEMAVAQWSMREGWNGRRVSHEVGKGILLAALDMLAAHFSGRPAAKLLPK